jgi:ABC-type antimicrobial peptide transport system permease subunit
MAIGAAPRSIGWMFLRESLALVAIGIAIGVPAAVAIAHVVSSILFGLSPHDAASLALALAVMIAAAVCASYVPARRAALIDVTRALRED